MEIINDISTVLYDSISIRFFINLHKVFSVYDTYINDTFLYLSVKSINNTFIIKIFRRLNNKNNKEIIKRYIDIVRNRKYLDTIPCVNSFIFRNNQFMNSILSENEDMIGIIKEIDTIDFNSIDKYMIAELIITYICFNHLNIRFLFTEKPIIKIKEVGYYRCYSMMGKRYIIKSYHVPVIQNIEDLYESKRDNNVFKFFIYNLLEIFKIKINKNNLLESFDDMLFNTPIFDVPIKYFSL